jgi:FixJ family two-component response regulator
MSEPCVHLVDDDAAVLRSLQRVLRAARVRTAAFESADAFLAAHSPDMVGCIVLDLSMPGLDGLELQRELAARHCQLPIVFLTGRGDIPSTVHAMQHGAVDFLTKPVDVEHLLRAVRAAFERDAQARAARAVRRALEDRFAALTAREREVLAHLLAGQLNKQIAARLGTAEKTIKVHRARIMQKLAVRSLADVARMAQAAGIAPAPAEDR